MAGSSWTASIGSLSVGGTSTCEIALAVLPDAGATLTNVASVSGGQADPNPLNNSPSAETRVAQVLLKALTFYDLGIDLSARFDGGGGEAGGQPLDLAPTEAEWLDVEPDGVAERNLPVAFTKGARVTLSAEFVIAPPLTAAEHVEIGRLVRHRTLMGGRSR